MARMKPRKCLCFFVVFIVINAVYLLIINRYESNDDAVALNALGSRQRNVAGQYNQHQSIRHTTFSLYSQRHHGNDTAEIRFDSLDAADHFLARTDLHSSQPIRVLVVYEPFAVRPPRFVTADDEELFMRSDRNRAYLESRAEEELTGVIEVIDNGTFQMDYTCGHASDYDVIRQPRIAATSSSNRHYDILAPLIVPMAFLFQHFLDGVVPKLMQVRMDLMFDIPEKVSFPFLLQEKKRVQFCNILNFHIF